MRLMLTGLLIFLLAACANSSNGEGNFSNSGKAGDIRPGEVIVRLCPDADQASALHSIRSYQLSLLHRASATLWTLGWQDERSIEEIISTLQQEATLFCAVQPNYQYKALDVNNREK
jgi:hypothetical protein